jgi:SRSO17 transposase
MDSFVGGVFSSLERIADRMPGCACGGLMLDGRRKSMQPMAARQRVDHQWLLQSVNSSSWEVRPVRKMLSRKVCILIEPNAWVSDDIGFANYGDASACSPPILGHPEHGRQLPGHGQRARRF